MEKRAQELLETISSLQFTDPESLFTELRLLVLAPSLPAASVSFCSSKLFNSEVSLTTFIKEHRSDSDRMMWKTVACALDLVSDYIKTRAEAVADYVQDIRDMCLQLLAASTKSSMVKEAGLRPLINIMEAFFAEGIKEKLNPRELFTVLLDNKIKFEERTMGSTLRGAVYHMLGLLFSRFEMEFADKAQELQDLLYRKLMEEIKKGAKTEERALAGILKGLAATVRFFHYSDVQQRELLRCLKVMLPPINEGRYTVSKAALKVLNENATVFAPHLREHLRPISETLIQLCESKSNLLRALAEECLENCMQKIAQEMHRQEPADLQNFEHLLEKFQTLLKRREDTRLLPMAVRAVGTLSGVIKTFKGERLLLSLLQQIVDLSQFHIFSEEEELDFKTLAYRQKQFAAFITAYASICSSLDLVTEEILLHMSKIGLKVFESNRLIVNKYRPLLTQAIALLIVSLSKQERSFQAWLRVFVASALKHILSQLDEAFSYDAEKQVGIAARLWQDILAREELSEKLRQAIADELAKYYELMLDTLNLQYAITPEKVCQFSSPGDYTTLTRAVSFARASFPGLSQWVAGWVLPLARKISQLVYQLPRISELYRLLKVLLIVAQKTKILTEDLEGAALMSSLLKDIVVRLREYEEDLLASCLELILAAPSELIISTRENNLSLWIPAVHRALELSVTQTRIAHLTITALKTWAKELDKVRLEEFLLPILPGLSAFLRLEKNEDGTVEATKRKVAYRTVKFLGSLGGMAHALVPDTVGALHTAWDTESRVHFALPISTVKLDVFLDPILPRVAALCEQSSDLKTRLPACELLHAIVLYMIGKSATSAVELSKQFSKLLPVAFRLATDMEQAPRQMFEPFTKQIVRWFAQAKTHDNAETMAVLDTLMEAISDPTNPALRALGSACLGEFIKTLAKLNQGAALVPHFKSVLRRVENFSNHPDAYKRIGALHCFKEVLPVLASHEAVIDYFLLEVGHVIFVTVRLTGRDLKSKEISKLCEEVVTDYSAVLERSLGVVTEENPRRAFHRNAEQFAAWLWDLATKAEELSRVLAQTLWIRLSGHLRIDRFLWLLQNYPAFAALRFEGEPKPALEQLATEVQFVIWTFREPIIQARDQLLTEKVAIVEGNIRTFLTQPLPFSLSSLKLDVLARVLEYIDITKRQILTVKQEMDLLTNTGQSAVSLTEETPELEAKLRVVQDLSVGILRNQRSQVFPLLGEYCRQYAESVERLSETASRVFLDGFLKAVLLMDGGQRVAGTVRKELEPPLLELLRTERPASVVKAKQILALFSKLDLAPELFTSLLSNAHAYQLLGDVVLEFISSHWETVAVRLFEATGREPDALLPLYPPILQRLFLQVKDGKLKVSSVIRSFAAISQILVQLSHSPVGDYSTPIARLLTFFIQECVSPRLATEAVPALEEHPALLTTVLDLSQVFTGVEKSLTTKREAMSLMAALWNLRVGGKQAWSVFLPLLQSMQGKYLPSSLVGAKKMREAPDIDPFVQGFLELASVTGHIEAIRLLYPLMRETNSDYAEEIQTCLNAFLSSQRVLDSSFEMFPVFLSDFMDVTLDTVLVGNARLAIARLILSPMIKSVDIIASGELLVQHANMLLQSLRKKFSEAGEAREFIAQTIEKSGVCLLLEAWYATLLPDQLRETVHKQLYGANSAGNELTKEIIALTHKWKGARPEHCELVDRMKGASDMLRDFASCSFACLCGVLRATQNAEKVFSNFVFNSAAGHMWKMLIDEGLQTDFKTETNFKLESVAKQEAPKPAPIVAQYLVGSLFTQSQTAEMLLPAPASEPMQVDLEPEGAEKLELDALNSLPIMKPLLAVLDKLAIIGIAAVQMPQWMQMLHSDLSSAASPLPVRLFIIKLILNRPKVFQPWANDWFEPIAKTMSVPENGGFGFHYFLRDVATLFAVTWDNCVPVGKTQVCSKLINYLIRVGADVHRQILLSNIEIIGALMNKWREMLTIDHKLVEAMLRRTGKVEKEVIAWRLAGVQFYALAVTHGIAILDNAVPKPQAIHEAVIHCLDFPKRQVTLAAAEVIGKALSAGAPADLKDQLVAFLARKDMHEIGLFVQLLDRLTLHFPQLLDVTQLALKLAPMFPSLSGGHRALLLHSTRRYFEFVAKGTEMKHVSELAEYVRRDLDKLINDEDDSHRLALTQLLCATVPLHTCPSVRRLLTEVMKLHLRTLTSCASLEVRRLSFQLARQTYDQSENLGPDAETCRSAAQSVLIKALADSDSEIRETAGNFWNDAERMSLDPAVRLEQTLSKLYVPSEEEVWLTAATFLMLKLCEGATDYSRLMFDRPLYQCEYRQLQVTPTFLTPLPSQPRSATHTEQFDVLMTPALPTQEMTLLVGVLQQKPTGTQASFVMPKPPTALIEAKRARYLPEGGAALQEERREQFKQRQMEKMLQRSKESRMKQASVIRSYWAGELPNTQILHKDVLLPLATLCRVDQELAGSVWLLLLSALYREALRGDLKTRIVSGLSAVLKSSEKLTPPVISTIHRSLIQIVRENPQLAAELDPKQVARSGVRAFSFQSAILLLQECILRLDRAEEVESPPVTEGNRDFWLGLAKVYTKLGEVESARGVWRRITANMPGDTLRQAFDYKAQGRLKTAKEAFSELRRQQVLDPVFAAEVRAEHIHALTELGDWEALRRETERDRTLSEVRIKVMLRLDQYGQLSDVMGAMPTVELVKRFPYESALLSVTQDDADRARYYVDESFKRFVEHWQSLNALSIHAKHQLVQQLQPLFESIEYLKLAQVRKDETNEEFSTRVEQSLLSWSRRLPSLHHDSEQVWEEVAYARVLFFDQLRRKHKLTLEKAKGFAGEMYALAAQCPLKLGKLEQAEVLLRVAVQKKVPEKDYVNVPLFISILKLRAKQYSTNLGTHLQELLQIIDGQKVDPEHIPDLELLRGYLYEKEVKNMLTGSPLALLSLAEHAFRHLEAAYHMKQDPANGLKLAKLCDSVLRVLEAETTEQTPGLVAKLNQTNMQLSRLAETVARCTLQAMTAGSAKAHGFFPRVLELLKYPTVTAMSRALFRDIPPWMCIRWISQILAIIDQPESEALVPLLKKLVQKYPQAVYYPYKCFMSVESGLQYDRIVHLERTDAWKTLEDGLRPYVFLDAFVDALECLTHPEHRFQYWNSVLKDHLESGAKNENFLVYWGAEMHTNLLAVDRPLLGRDIGAYNAKFAEKWRMQLQALLGDNGMSVRYTTVAKLQQLSREISATLIPSGHEALNTFSEWLAKYDITEHSGQEIELPGQYSGLREPLAHASVKCVSFDQTVLVLESLRKPKRLGVHGSDEKEYLLLVKGGEDLRLDQRVQQLFGLMNLVFRQDPECAKANIRLKTFQVVPLSKRLGVLEWVQNTEPLKSVITKELDRYTGIKDLYSTEGSRHRIHWINSISGGHQKVQENHVLALQKPPEEIIAHFRQHEANVKWDLVRRALMSMAATQESFIGIRSEFMKSLAVVSVCGYMLGIGDRHLDNFLVDKSDGGLLAIDFGYSFGTAVHLGVPELMPFRLTRQLRSVLAPEGVDGEFRHTMVACLRALRKQKNAILDCSEVFIKEPLLDWQKQAMVRDTSVHASDTYQSQVESIAWYPKKKISAVRMKLEGYNPAHILQAELADSRHAHEPYFKQITDAVRGARNSIRSRTPQFGLSPEQQADCLIEHATDPNILGRTWIGWLPHI